MVKDSYTSGRQMQGDGGWAENTMQVYPINEDTGEPEVPLEVRLFVVMNCSNLCLFFLLLFFLLLVVFPFF